MKKTAFILIGLAIVILAKGQTVKIQGGTSISRLDWEINGANPSSLFYNKALIGYSLFTGLDYMDKKYFNLSTNIGLIRKGGKDESQLTDEYNDLTGLTITEKAILDYFTVNTTINLRYRIKDSFYPFVSFGPRIDFLVNNSNHFDHIKEEGWLETTSYGLVLGGGVNYDISKLIIGIKADYNMDFKEIADWTDEAPEGGSKITGQTFMVNLFIGYKL